MTDSSHENQRESVRLSLILPISLFKDRAGTYTLSVGMLDVSSGGIGFELEAGLFQFMEGKSIDLCIAPPGCETIEAQGRIVHVTSIPDLGMDRVGMQFVQISDAHQAILDTYLANRK